jgi:hypothetical protein
MDENTTHRNLFDPNGRGEIRVVQTPEGAEEIRWIAEK